MRVVPRSAAAPTSEPVTLPQLRDHIRLDDNVDDAAVLGFGITARELIEQWLGRPILPRSVAAVFEAWPDTFGETVEIDMPVTSVDGVTYTAVGGAVVPWTGWVARTSQGGVTFVRPAAGQNWPDLGDDPLITITATAGWSQPPESIVTAICITAAYLNANRDGTGPRDDGMGKLPPEAMQLIRPWKWRLIG